MPPSKVLVESVWLKSAPTSFRTQTRNFKLESIWLNLVWGCSIPEALQRTAAPARPTRRPDVRTSERTPSAVAPRGRRRYHALVTKLKPILALAFATSIALTGCSGSSTDESTGSAETTPTETQSPATPETTEPLEQDEEGEEPPSDGGEVTREVTGTDYTFTAPEGWQTLPGDTLAELTENVPGAEFVDAMVMAPTGPDGFTENINVIPVPEGQGLSEETESQRISELEASGATDVTPGDPVVVAGKESPTLSSIGTEAGSNFRSDQVYISGPDATYVVTFTFSESKTEAERTELTQSVLDTWTWN